MSVPNVAFGSIRLSLLNGCFDYVDSGILEKTHLRFFTLKSLEEFISDIKINLEKCILLHRDLLSTEIRVEQFKSDLLSFNKIMKDDLSSVYQFIVVLTRHDVITETLHFGKKMKYPLLRYLLRRGLHQLAIKFKRVGVLKDASDVS